MTEYTIEEASRLSGITVRSLRNYVHQYQDFLKLKRGAYNALLFDDENLEMLVKIKSLLRDGKTCRQICDILEAEEQEPTITVTKHAVAPAAAPAEHPVLVPLLKKVDTVLTEILEENRRLHSRLEDLEAQIIQQRALPAPSASTSLNLSSSASAIPLPYFVLAAKDGCIAVARSFWSTFIGGRRKR